MIEWMSKLTFSDWLGLIALIIAIPMFIDWIFPKLKNRLALFNQNSYKRRLSKLFKRYQLSVEGNKSASNLILILLEFAVNSIFCVLIMVIVLLVAVMLSFREIITVKSIVSIAIGFSFGLLILVKDLFFLIMDIKYPSSVLNNFTEFIRKGIDKGFITIKETDQYLKAIPDLHTLLNLNNLRGVEKIHVEYTDSKNEG